MDQDKKQGIVILIGLALIIAVALITFFRPSQKGNNDFNAPLEKISYKTISAEEINERMKNQEPINVIDLRGKDEYETEHVVGSINITAEEIEAADINFPKEEPIVLIGNEKNIADFEKANGFLTGKGWTAFVFEGSIELWKSAVGNTISWGNPESFTDQAKVTYISQEELENKMKNEASESYFILDARLREKFSEKRIAKARNVPLDELESQKSEIPFSKQIIAYGETELEGFRAGVKLYDLGFYNVLVLREGFSKWKEKGFPTEQ